MIEFEESQVSGYKDRTIKNASADITMAFAINFSSGGEILTKKSVLEQGKKYVPINAYDLNVTQKRVDKIVKFINRYSISELMAEDVIEPDAIKFIRKDKINSEGYYEELSNFTASFGTIYDDLGLEYAAVESCYQAQKTLDKEERLKFTIDKLRSPYDYGNKAKKMGQELEKRFDWNTIKYEVMRRALVWKFKDENFKNILLSTGNRQIIEWTWWSDKIWGKSVKNGQGANALGKLLMELRTNFQNQREYTPDEVLSLPSNGIFVFGSNAEGIHKKGAALVALNNFGAILGQAEGLMNNSYGIITKKNWRVEKSSTLQEIGKGVQTMLLFAKDNQQLKFYVTKIGSSLAGYTIREIKSLFEKLKHIIPDNVILPREYEVRMAKSRRDITLNIAGNGIYTLMKAGSKITQEQLDKFVYEMLYAIITHPEFAFNVKMIRSGGQSGGDLSGNRAALKLGIPTKVLAPKGWLYREIEGIDISDEIKFKERFTA